MNTEAEVIWHEVECGAYAGDLACWRELAAEAAGPTLELGCGAGRVSLDLARSGREVMGLDRSAALVAELLRRAARDGLEVAAEVGDARDFALGRRFALVVAPMQLVHLLGPAGRAGLFGCARAHLEPGGRVAVALLAGDALAGDADASPPLPDVREVDGWVYSSQPLDVTAEGETIAVRRLRQTVSPAGELREEIDTTRLDALALPAIEAQAREAGLELAESIPIAATSDHVGSEIGIWEER